MKNIYILITVFSLFVLTSCEDFLDEKPYSSIGENGFYTTDAEVEAAMIGVYDALQEVPKREFAVTEMRSDNAKTRLSEGDWGDCEVMSIHSTNSLVLEYWNANYITIYRTNVVLENLEVVQDADLKKQLQGEALFVRAMCHFNMARAFKNAPYVDKVVSPEAAPSFPQSTAAAIYPLVATDLTTAISLLPSKSGIEQGRATSGAAQALLGKVQLTAGNYAAAQTAFAAVIADDYALETNYNDVFYSEMNDEIVFAVQYMDGNEDNSQDFSSEFTALGTASGVNTPTDDLKAAYVLPDLRYTTCVIDSVNECAKFVNENTLAGNDWIVIRYADVLLMYVEATLAGAETVVDATALGYLNAVQNRAGVTLATSITKDALLLERRLELAFENSRWFDLERFDEQDLLIAFAASESFSFAETDLVLPIPNREIVSSDVMDQNSGY